MHHFLPKLDKCQQKSQIPEDRKIHIIMPHVIEPVEVDFYEFIDMTFLYSKYKKKSKPKLKSL
jgi:hypothetical protein